MQDQEFANAKKDLTKQFGKEPSLNDIKWRVYNQRILEYASKRQWGLYTNNKYQIASLLEKEKKFKDALNAYFEVCYLDINGCNNIPISNGKPLSFKECNELGIKDFDPSTTFLAPAVISSITDLIEQLKLNEKDAKKAFVEINEKKKLLKKMPLTPEEAWKKISSKIVNEST